MFRHSQRGTLVWLFIVGLALSMMLFAGEVPNSIAATLLAAYLALAVLVARNVRLNSVLGSLPARGTRQAETTEVAREAAARARNHPSYDPLIRLQDVGLVVDEHRPDGLALRRGRFVSLDDDGVRPFAIADIPESLGNRLARVRFEIRNESGRIQYVYEDDKWLQAGENPILPDYRLPIRKNRSSLEAGTWAVHFMIDNRILGVHHFNLSPSLQERRQQVTSDGEIRERIWRTEEEDASLPLSLEELLRQQSRERFQKS